MALTETVRFFVGIQDDGQIEFRRTRIIMDGEEVVAEKHFRQVLDPGQDVSAFPAKVRQHCAIAWTPAVIAAWEAKKAAQGLP